MDLIEIRRTFFLFILLLTISIYGEKVDLTPEEDTRDYCITDLDFHPKNGRVVGGTNAGKTTFRYATGILMPDPIFGRFRTDDAFCGGTLITNKHVMTAAHCLYQSMNEIESLRLNIGDYDTRDKTEVKNYIARVKNAVLHPNYVDEKFFNDIAIIEFEPAIELGEDMRAAILPPFQAELPIGTICTVMGWGRTAYDGSRSSILQMVDVPVTDRKECQSHLSHKITEKMICAGGEEGRDACLGDSGGSLLVRTDNVYVTTGIVSFGKKCALKDVSGVYTKVSDYTRWIHENTRSADCRPRQLSRENYPS